ncbi:hypothetical protein [Rhodococcus koreensis]|nr:hypothetical protein [Rhodococcus koreensis]
MHLPQPRFDRIAALGPRGQPAPRATVDLRPERQTDGIPFSFF